MESILSTIKTMLNVESTENAFDQELILYINSALELIEQLIGDQDNHIVITGTSEKWTDYFTCEESEIAKLIVYLRVKLIFDPPSTTTAFQAMENMCKEYEWRLTIQRGE